MAAALKRAYLLALLLLLAAAPLPARASIAQAGQGMPPPAPPAAQSARASEEEANRKKANDLLVEVFTTPGMDLPTQQKKLIEALKFDPTNGIIISKLTEVQRQLEEQKKQGAEQQKQADAATATQKNAQQHTRAANDAYMAAAAGGGSAALQRANSEITSALALNPKDAAAMRLRMLIEGDLRTQRIRMIMWYATAAVVALGGIIGALKLRPKPTSLEITEGPQAGELLPLRKKLVIIGTMESQVDWVLDDPAHRVSRRHCEISRRYRRHYVVDCSTNGTHLNGVLLQRGDPAALRPGDLITLGGAVTIRFQ